MQPNKKSPVILAITAASGIIYGIRVLEFLLKNDYKVELIISSKAYYIFEKELGIKIRHDKNIIKDRLIDYLQLNEETKNLKVLLDDEFWAGPASGSYKTAGMIIAPASMATVAAAAAGLAETLILRAVDVTIKENRSLVIVPRETPLSSIHLENMLKLSKTGAKIVPPSIGFYGKIETLKDCTDFVAGKILDAAGISNNLYERWQ